MVELQKEQQEGEECFERRNKKSHEQFFFYSKLQHHNINKDNLLKEVFSDDEEAK